LLAYFHILNLDFVHSLLLILFFKLFFFAFVELIEEDFELIIVGLLLPLVVILDSFELKLVVHEHFFFFLFEIVFQIGLFDDQFVQFFVVFRFYGTYFAFHFQYLSLLFGLRLCEHALAGVPPLLDFPLELLHECDLSVIRNLGDDH